MVITSRILLYSIILVVSSASKASYFESIESNRSAVINLTSFKPDKVLQNAKTDLQQINDISILCLTEYELACCNATYAKNISNHTIVMSSTNSSVFCIIKDNELIFSCNGTNYNKSCTKDSPSKNLISRARTLELEAVLLLIINAIMFVIGVTGNFMVVLAIITKKRLQNLQNYFLFNLAITDLFTLIVFLPYSTKNLIDPTWPFGVFSCKYLLPVLDIVPSVSVLTMVAISIDRYRAITRAMSHTISIKSTVVLLLFLWLVCYFIVAFPVSFFMILTKKNSCKPHIPSLLYSRAYYTTRLVLLYVLPSLAIFICYVRVNKTLWHSMRFLQRSVTGKSQIISLKRQKHVMSMFFVIFLTFAVCFLPFNVIIMIFNYASPDVVSKYKRFMVHAMNFAQVLGIGNSVCNPIILYRLSKAYRTKFQSYLPFLKWCSSRHKELPDDQPTTTRHMSLTDHQSNSFNKKSSFGIAKRLFPFSLTSFSPKMKWKNQINNAHDEQEQSKELLQNNNIILQDIHHNDP